MNRIARRCIHTLLNSNKSFPEICSSISSKNVSLATDEVDVAARKQELVKTAGKDQGRILSGLVRLQNDQFLRKISSSISAMRPVLHELEPKMCLVPVGKHAAMLDTSPDIHFALIESGTWPSIVSGAETIDNDTLKETLVSHFGENVSELENRFSISNSGALGELSLVKREFCPHVTLAAEWVSFCVRLDPVVPILLNVLLSWAKKTGAQMDEEIFIHFVLFYLAHRNHIPSMETIMQSQKKGQIHIPPPANCDFSKTHIVAPFDVITKDFFTFMNELDVESNYLNTFDGKLVDKSDVEDDDIVRMPGLTMLHPFIQGVFLVPLD